MSTCPLVPGSLPRDHICHVVSLGADVDMARATTEPKVARMISLFAYRYLPTVVKLPGYLVGRPILVVNTEGAVWSLSSSAKLPSSPRPTPVKIRSIYLGPETLRGGRRTGDSRAFTTTELALANLDPRGLSSEDRVTTQTCEADERATLGRHRKATPFGVMPPAVNAVRGLLFPGIVSCRSG